MTQPNAPTNAPEPAQPDYARLGKAEREAEVLRRLQLEQARRKAEAARE